MRCGLELLERTAIAQPVTRWQGDFTLNLALRLSDEASEIPTANVGAYDQAPLSILTGYLIGTRSKLQSRNFT